MSSIRSLNNNVFHFSNYSRSWSRILFHDHGGRGMESMRKHYNIPKHIKTIEVDIVPQNFRDWERLAQVNIRCHCTSLIGYPDKYQGSISYQMLMDMEMNLPGKVVDILLHSNLLEFIDFDKYKEHCNGGAPIAKIIKDVPTLREYWLDKRSSGSGPGLLIYDVEDEWQRYCKQHAEHVAAILP